MFILCLVCFWHAVVSVMEKTVHEDDKYFVQQADVYALVIIGVLYVIFHIAFFANIYLDVSKILRVYRSLPSGCPRRNAGCCS